MPSVTYNHYEQSKIDALEELEAAQRRGEVVNQYLYERVKKEAELAEHNAACRAERQAKLAAQAEEKRRADKAAQHQAVQAQIDAFKAQARRRFIGSDAEFEAQWPSIKAEWQRRLALGDGDPAVEVMRSELRQLYPDRYGRL